MVDRIYLGDAFGWQTEEMAKVGILQFREQCPSPHCWRAQLIKNENFRCIVNGIKIAAYIPGLNFFMGGLAIYYAGNHQASRPNDKEFWIVRGIAMIFTGPLLIVIDLVKFIFDQQIVSQFRAERGDLLERFDVNHGHTLSYWPDHPVNCLMENGELLN